MNVKCLALDMDGTLLTEDKRISESNLYWIRRAMDAGVHVCLASGRDHRDMLPYYDQLRLSTPFVSVNGGEVWKDGQTLVSRALLDGQMVRKLHELAVRYDTWHWAFGLERVYTKDRWISELDAESWMMYCYYTEDDAIRETIKAEIRKFAEGQVDITNSNPKYIEIVPTGISKATGMQTVCEMLGIVMSDVIAVGDGLNDLAMIQEAGLGVAMENAQQTLKDASDAIAPSNREDGVAAIIREVIFGESTGLIKQ